MNDRKHQNQNNNDNNNNEMVVLLQKIKNKKKLNKKQLKSLQLQHHCPVKLPNIRFYLCTNLIDIVYFSIFVSIRCKVRCKFSNKLHINFKAKNTKKLLCVCCVATRCKRIANKQWHNNDRENKMVKNNNNKKEEEMYRAKINKFCVFMMVIVRLSKKKILLFHSIPFV